MVMEIFSDESKIDNDCTLNHNAIYMGIKHGHTNPFHYQEQLAMQSVNARVLARLYTVITADGRSLDLEDRPQVDRDLQNLSFPTMLRYIEIVRQSIFSRSELSKKQSETKKKGRKKMSNKNNKKKQSAEGDRADQTDIDIEEADNNKDTIDYRFDGHKRFIQYMETYYTFKQAIQYGDVGHIRRLYPRFALLFFGGNKIKYGILSLYMI